MEVELDAKVPNDEPQVGIYDHIAYLIHYYFFKKYNLPSTVKTWPLTNPYTIPFLNRPYTLGHNPNEESTIKF